MLFFVLGLAILLGSPRISSAAHDMGNDCYYCHSLRGGAVWDNTYSIAKSSAIGGTGEQGPVNCDFCHTDYGAKFIDPPGPVTSGHPVRTISGSSIVVQLPKLYPAGLNIDCHNCHRGDTKAGGKVPDLAPKWYGIGGEIGSGHPDHDMLGTVNNRVDPGDPPHLGTWESGQPDNLVTRTYTKSPASAANVLSNFNLCLVCHNNSGRTTGTDNIAKKYVDSGHFFKTAGTFGGTPWNAGDRIPCSDCHASHSSPTNKYNFEPDNTTFSGTRPTGKTTNRAICLSCHDGLGGTSSSVTVRGRTPTSRTTGITEHQLSDTTPCKNCHDAHNPPAGCNNCHGDPPPPAPFSGTTVSWVAVDNASVPASVGLHDNHVTSYGLGSCNATCHVSATHATNKTSANMGVAGNPGTGVFQYSTVPSYAVWDNGGTAGNVSVADDHCNNVLCHDSTYGSPANVYKSAGNPGYTRYWNRNLDCYSCHAYDGRTATIRPGGMDNVMATGSHRFHVDNTQMACNRCHPSSAYTINHKSGFVDWSFAGSPNPYASTPAYSIASGTRKPTDNTAGNGYYGTCTNLYCHGTGTGLTGGANQATGTTNVSTWGTASTGKCGSCHGAPGATTNYPPATYVGTQDYPSSGAHARHMSSSDAAGPRISACTDCHTSEGVGTHVDGKVDFRTRYDNTTATTKALTQTCDPCHALGVATAKANWDTVGSLDCLTCHGATVAYTYANATGRVAPNVAGDNSTYGSNATGHNRPSGSNYASGNPSAQQTCTACHDLAISHIDGTDNTTYTGNRLLGTVNTVPGITTVSGMCAACHTRGTLSSPATKKNVNTHGNAGFPDRLEAVFADRACDQCHEPHGMVNVTASPTGVNLWMIDPTITVTAGTTVSPVRLFAKTGANSFDNTGTTSDLYRACHANASNPGYPMIWNVAGQHAAPNYSGDERGKDCSGCHSHNQDDNTATVDGLMPLACNACHSYPGLDNSASVKQMSAGHAKHAGTPTDTTNTKGYDCTHCHYNYNHNQSRIAKGAAWPANYYDNVNIDFDPAWNPGSTTYRGLAVPTTGNGGTGVCAGLYCHGNNATLNAGWAGSAATPAWSGIGTASCGTCHDAGTADTTPATTFSTKNHPVHINLTSKAYGPGLAAFSAGGNCAEGTGCHPKPLLRPLSDPAGMHVNNAKNLRSTATDNGEVGATIGATQVCRNCHTTYTSANVPTSGDALARTQANWDNNAYLLPCITCHNGTAAGTQATADIGGAGARAAAIEGTYFASGHGLYGFPAPLECGWCHSNTMGHIGAARPIATNPWRIGISSFTALGRMDSYCSTDICHGSAVPNNHTWIANGAGYVTSKETTDTHPTTVPAVGTNKDRWYQVPSSAHVPLFGNILDNNYNKTGGTNNYVLCVSCHDPHGVGTLPVPSTVRTFSGQNTDAKGNKMLRFNYSTGAPTALCSQCHK